MNANNNIKNNNNNNNRRKNYSNQSEHPFKQTNKQTRTSDSVSTSSLLTSSKSCVSRDVALLLNSSGVTWVVVKYSRNLRYVSLPLRDSPVGRLLFVDWFTLGTPSVYT